MLGVAVEIERRFMQLPHEWCRQEKTASASRYSMEFLKDAGWLGDVLENLSQDDRIKRLIANRKVLCRGDDVAVGRAFVDRVLPVDRDVVRVLEKFTVRRLARSHVRYI